MRENTFLETVKLLQTHAQKHETITFFELSQLFGSSLFSVIIFCAALPPHIFSTQWVVLPLTTFIIFCAIWFFFDNQVWMPDGIKAIAIPSQTIQKATTWIEKVCQLETWSDLPSHFWPKLRVINIILLGATAFQIGYFENPTYTSFLSVFTLLLISVATLFEKGWLSCVGYVLFLIGIL